MQYDQFQVHSNIQFLCVVPTYVHVCNMNWIELKIELNLIELN